MPFEASRAIAATFCWNIRHALTPVFGVDFLSQCIHPDSNRFGEMVIDVNITKRCAEEAKKYRTLENSPLTRSLLTPDSPPNPTQRKQLRTNALKTRSTASGNSTDSGSEDNYSLMPGTMHTQYRHGWTVANTPRSLQIYDSRLPSPQEILAGIAPEAKEQKGDFDEPSDSATGSPLLLTKPRRVEEMFGEYGGGRFGEQLAAENVAESLRRKRTAPPLPSDEEAAILLMSLRMKRPDLEEARS